MALNPLMLHRVASSLHAGSRVASMGYPDIVSMPELVKNMLGDKINDLLFHSDSARICRRHGVKDRPVPGAHCLFELLGAKLEVFDLGKGDLVQHVVDLNHPIPHIYLAQYDFVMDIGTMEHCFNIGQAAVNMAGMVNGGGMILHENPFNWGNHGFYGLNPTWYGDFYGQDGFELKECRILPRGGDPAGEDIPPFDRFFYSDGEANLFASAIRNTVKHIGFPIQNKYSKVLGAAAGCRA